MRALPCLWPYLLASACGGVLVALGGIHRWHNSDSLLPVLVSVQHWTPFFWEQDRYGMLVPLLAMPFPHPLTNLLVQTGLTAASGFAALVLAARYLDRDASWPTVAIVATIALLVLAPSRFLWMALSTWTPAAPSLALGLGSLVLAIPAEGALRPSRVRLIAAVVCILLACWVNAAIGLFLFPLAVTSGAIRAMFEGSRSRHLRELGTATGLIALGTFSAIVAQSLAEFQGTGLTIVPPADYWARIVRVPVDFWTDMEPRTWIATLAVCLGIGLGMLLVPRTRRRAGESLAIAAAVGIAGFAFAVAMAAVSMGYWRYSLPVFLVLHVAIVGALVRPLVRDGLPSWANLALTLAMLSAIPLMLGGPSVAMVRTDLGNLVGRPEGVSLPAGYDDRPRPTSVEERANAVVAARCTHVAGSYWFTGPVVFLANVKLADQGEPRTVWGLSLRSRATQAKWKAVPLTEVRVGLFPSDPGAAMGLREFGAPLERTETTGPLDMFTAKTGR